MPDVLFGVGIVVYGARKLGTDPALLVAGIFPLLCGMLTLYSLWFMLASTSIWFVKIYNVTEVLNGLLEAGRFPIVAFPAAYRFFFTFIVPVAFLTTVPAQVFVGRTEVSFVLGGFFISVVSFFIARFFWTLATRSYTSASS
jgi:ABC-2 type transport system permease protein